MKEYFWPLSYLAFAKRLKFYIKYCMNEKPCPESQMLKKQIFNAHMFTNHVVVLTNTTLSQVPLY